MKKNKLITLAILSTLCLGTTSCEKMVKGATKKATEVTISAIEGVVEAVDEKGGVLAEKATDATGSVAEGMGRSVERQLNENTTKVFSTVGRTMVQSADGALNGMGEGMINLKPHYNELDHTDDLPSGVSIDLIGKQKINSIVDTYFIVTQAGKYNYEFQALDANGTVLISKDIEIEKKEDDKSQYTLVSIGLDKDESLLFAKTSRVKATVKK